MSNDGTFERMLKPALPLLDSVIESSSTSKTPPVVSKLMPWPVLETDATLLNVTKRVETLPVTRTPLFAGPLPPEAPVTRMSLKVSRNTGETPVAASPLTSIVGEPAASALTTVSPAPLPAPSSVSRLAMLTFST